MRKKPKNGRWMLAGAVLGAAGACLGMAKASKSNVSMRKVRCKAVRAASKAARGAGDFMYGVGDSLSGMLRLFTAAESRLHKEGKKTGCCKQTKMPAFSGGGRYSNTAGDSVGVGFAGFDPIYSCRTAFVCFCSPNNQDE